MKKTFVITAGGTIEKIDSVRSIRNTSSGKLGANIANELKAKYGDECEVYYISNKDSIKPNCEYNWIETDTTLSVKSAIEDLLSKTKVDVFVHSMAVADYFVSGIESDGEFFSTEDLLKSKLSSSNDEIKVVLNKTPKLISLIKGIQPHIFLVGFKLLNDVPEEELFNVGFNLLRKNRCNLVVANDLTTIKAGNHTGMFIVPEKKYEKVVGKENVSKHLVELIDMRAFCKRSNSFLLEGDFEISDEIFNEMKKTGEILYNDGLLPVVEGGTYGNLSIKSPEGFYITGRNVHKGDLTKDIICKIEKVDEIDDQSSVYSKVYYKGKVKPSIDTSIHASIYDKLLEVNSILHIHTDNLYNRPLSSYNYPCGSMEERNSIVSLMDNSNLLIQMKKHGIISCGFNLQECLKEWIKLNDELFLEPLLDPNHPSYLKWVEHRAELNIDNIPECIEFYNHENFYIIKENDVPLGTCYLKTNGDYIDFIIYSDPDFHGKGMNIGKKVLNILKQVEASEGKKLRLNTVNECNVLEYYIKKGFEVSEKQNSLIKMTVK